MSGGFQSLLQASRENQLPQRTGLFRVLVSGPRSYSHSALGQMHGEEVCSLHGVRKKKKKEREEGANIPVSLSKGPSLPPKTVTRPQLPE